MDITGTDSTEAPQDVSVADLLNQQSDSVASPSETSTESSEGAVTSDTTNTEAVSPTLKDRVAELGFENVADDNDAQARLIEAYAQQQARQAELQQQMELLRYQMQLAAQTKPPVVETAQAQTKQDRYWNPPPVNRELIQRFVTGRDENGKVQWSPNTPPQVIAEFDAFNTYVENHSHRLVNDFGSIEAELENRLMEKAKNLVTEQIQQYTQKQAAETFVQQQIREHEDIFYQKDPVTNTIRRDFQGREMLTEAGVRFDSIIAELANSGISDETTQWKLAQQIYQGRYGDLKQQAANKMDQARAGHAAKAAAATHIAQRNGQETNGATSGRRQQLEGLGGSMFSNPEFTRQLQWS